MTAALALPIDALLPELARVLVAEGRAVLVAPPGAGKTTRVPLALLPVVAGRIVLLEPRRLAARAAAERLAETLGEAVGATVGYRIRGEARVGAATRIEVVTEGILTRMLQSDPGLTGIGCVIFDEFHERSLNADLGLALTWEARGALRPDLKLLVMSATLDAGPLAALLDAAPVLVSEGRAYPVETRWLGRPIGAGMHLAAATAALVAEALAETEGGVLVFLPGEGEIRRTAALLAPRLPEGVALRPLFGAMEFAAQRAAIAPAPGLRKLVLATAIAETSLTIEDVRVVVDAGRARRARFDPGSGLTRLVTERVSRAEATQRRGRAGRLGPGVCYRLWTQGEEGALAAFAPPEIETADLAGLALELAAWGSDGAGLAFLTPPPAPALAEARALLAGLGAIDSAGRITPHGRVLAALPLHPRLAHMLVTAGPAAAPLAALMEERDSLGARAPADLSLRVAALENPSRFEAEHALRPNRGVLERARTEAKRLARMVKPPREPLSLAEAAATAYPDRIGQRRPGEGARFLLANGKGAVMDAADPLARAALIVASELDGDLREARIRQAVELPEASLRRLFAEQIRREESCIWSRRDGKVVARRQERLGALILAEAPWPDPPQAAVAEAALEGVRQIGLVFSEPARRLRARIALLHREGANMPDVADAALLASAEVWLAPFLGNRRSEADLRALDLAEPLRAWLTHAQRQLLETQAPAHFTTPLGRAVPIDYEGAAPAISVRLQELFGQRAHPCVGPRRLPLQLTLLSPGGKPMQVTQDLPGFWAGTYAEVRRDMRGRYPRHPWPEDPLQAEPTVRAKPRGS